MSTILRISEATSLALHAMALLARDPERVLSTHAIARALHASEAHLSKVMQRLHKARLVTSVRGAAGGFLPEKPADDVSILDIYEAIEGPIPDATCLLGKPICDRHPCVLGRLLETVNREVRRYFTDTRLSQLELAAGKRNASNTEDHQD